MNLLSLVPGVGTMRTLLRAAPFVVLGLLLAALVVERTTVVRVTAERDRIIRVVDPSGKATPDQAIALAQDVLMQRDAAKSALTVTTANYRRATAVAQAADLNHARAVEQHDAAISGKVQHDLEAQLTSARDAADAHARELRANAAASAPASADRGSGGAAGVSGSAGATSGTPGSRSATELDDSRACAAGVTLAEGWQRWWAEVTAAPR